MQELILTIMADDRPGIVEKISRAIESEGGNWLDSELACMAGKFAGIVRISCESTHSVTLTKALNNLAEQGIRVTVDEGKSTSSDSPFHLSITVTANDRPGIIREVSDCLARLNINLANLKTEVASAAMSSGPLFTATFQASMPAEVKIEQLVIALEELSDDLMVDIEPEI